jgi:hypothetical protein
MWNPVSYQGPHVPMQLSCVAEEEDSEACSGCMNQVVIPIPTSAHERLHSLLGKIHTSLPPRLRIRDACPLSCVGLCQSTHCHLVWKHKVTHDHCDLIMYITEMMCEVDLTGRAAIRVPGGKTEFLSGR